MSDTSSRQLGQLALDRGLVSAGQLREALDEFRQRKAAGSRMPLGEVLVEMGHLTRPQLEQLLGAQGGKKSPRQIIAGFELIRKLGEGGMGATYLARQESMDRLVALKILRKSLSRDEEFVARFRREAQLAGKLDHVNIVQAIDVGEAAGFHYLIMEYVEGRNLNDLLPESGPMSEDLALHFVIQIARALGFADKQDIIHRDIKPDNVMVTAENIAKLCDFGLARQTGSESKLTQTGTAMGTPHYVSPEQARGDRGVDIRSDIYSLGATLYHLVTGETPFSGSSAVVVMTKHLTEQLPWPQDINPGLSESCAQVISRMMAKNPADRYQTPAELVTDLEMAIDGKAPDEANLAPGLSSVATRGTVPIVVQPLDAKPRRYRQTHLLAPVTGTDPTMPMVAAAGSSPEGSRLKLLVAGAGAAALLVIALLIWSLTGGPAKTPEPRERDKQSPPPDGQQAVPDKQQQELRAMYAYAQKWWKDHPDEFEEARRKFEGMREKAGGVLAMQIEDAVREIDKAEQQAITGALAAKREGAAIAKTLTGLLDAVDALLKKGDREAATRTLGSRKQALPAATRRQLAPQLTAMARIISEMNLFDAAHRRAVKALVGKRVSIKTRKGASYTGKVTSFSEEKGFIEVERSYSIGGQPRTKRYQIKFEDLADGEFEKLIKGREPTTPQAFMALAVMAIHAGDVHFAPGALKEAGANPLKDYYSRRLKAVKKNTGDDRARWEWEHEVLPQVRKKYTPEQASKLVGQLEAWLRENDGTGFHAEHQQEAKDILRVARKAAGDAGARDPGEHRPRPGPGPRPDGPRPPRHPRR
jgi:eukaryotic-like serine/threonine-protein kinase